MPNAHNWRYCTIQVTGDRVLLVSRFSFPMLSGSFPCGSQPSPLSNGSVYYVNTIYHTDGTSDPITPGWVQADTYYDYHEIYTYYYGKGILERNETTNRWRWQQFTPKIEWKLPSSASVHVQGMTVTNDGRYYIQHTSHAAKMPNGLCEIVKQYLHLELPSFYYNHSVCLYTAPKQLTGVISYQGRCDGQYGDVEYYTRDGYLLPDGRRVQLRAAYPASDGSRLVAVEYDREYPIGFVDENPWWELESSFPNKPNGSLLFFRRR